MHFPFYIGPIHPHPLFEALGYLVAAQVFRWLRSRRGDALDEDARGWLIVAAVVGGAVGSKVLYWASDPAATLGGGLVGVMGGKSVVGGLVGALVAVELAKRRMGIARATGDLFALPCALGIAVGRVGCFLTGLDDHTYGLPTTLPWGVDFGDGIPRHPTQLYEIAFLLLLSVVLYRWRPAREGDAFKLFLGSYAAFRIWLEFLKPGVFVGGLNAIQWVCVAVLAYYCVPRLRLARA